jgi:ABC-type branched-subunit amino acid transport system substrate-binding protein
MIRKKWRSIAVLAAFGLVAVACGDDDDDAGTEATEPTTGAPTTGGGAPPTTGGGDTTPTTGGDGTTATTTDDTEGTTATTTGASVDPASIETDVGVDDSTIKVGMLADLSGAFAPLVTEIVEAQEVYWDKVNEEGGIAGRQIELVVEDNGYDVATHLEKYEAIRNEVAIISQSTGSPHTSAIAQNLVTDNLVAIPLSWYSGWPDPEFGQNVFESYTTYCIESMNGIEWLAQNREVQSVALISFPGEYGGDGDAGARMAIEELGLEIAYDGVGQVTPPSADNPNPDQSAVISQIVSANADLVWATINPATLAAIMGGAVQQGYQGLWSGNSPTYSFKLLGTELAPLLDEHYIASTYIVTWGADVPGMQAVVDAMTAAKPDLAVSDVFILGWTEGQITKAILEQAAANGDMTREGIVAAANEVSVTFDGLAPDQSWAGDPNDFLVRESYIYDVVLDQYNPISLGEGEGSTGWELLEGPYTGEVATNYTYEGPCFEPTG